MTKRGNVSMKAFEINETVKVLNRAYADELLAYHQCLMEAKLVQGTRKDEVATLLLQHAEDELRHGDMLADRILELEKKPLLNPKGWCKDNNCGYEEPSAYDELSILENAIKSEEGSIYVYSQLAAMSRDNDMLTYDLVYEILDEQMEHKEDLEALYNDIKSSMS